jgi:hypothetical protein
MRRVLRAGDQKDPIVTNDRRCLRWFITITMPELTRAGLNEYLLIDVPEYVTSLLAAIFILSAFWSPLRATNEKRSPVAPGTFTDVWCRYVNFSSKNQSNQRLMLALHGIPESLNRLKERRSLRVVVL